MKCHKNSTKIRPLQQEEVSPNPGQHIVAHMNKVPCEIPNVIGLIAHVHFFSNCLFGAALFQSACLLKLCVFAMKRGDKEDARQRKQLPPPEKIRSFWVENLPPNGLGLGILPPNGLGHGITSACFNLRNHQPYHIKLSTIDNATPLTVEWAEPIYIHPNISDENLPRLEYRP